MPLHGKIVVVKRSGVDGTEFPLTASCLFGRKPDCDIRIQLPQVSKEHCRIDLNENKEVILTNLSSVNPTRVNGEALQQCERLKHGDVITIVDRSFRFEYPPAPTPKKRSSTGGKSETFKVLQDQHVGDTDAIGTGEKKISEVSTGPHLKDGANHDNIQRAVEKTVEVESKEDGSMLQSKTASPFNDLYQMIKKSLDVKTPRKSSGSKFQTPSSKVYTPKCGTVMENDEKPAISTEATPKKDEAKVSLGAGNETPKSVKKQRRSSQLLAAERTGSVDVERANSKAISPQKKSTVSEVIEQISAQTPKSPMRRRSKESTAAKEQEQAMPAEHLRRTSPRNSGKVEKELSKKRKSGELASDLPKPQMKKKRVSFGDFLSPELFDKKLPPDSPLRKGAAPRRSLCLTKPKQSLLRRASVIGLLKEVEQEHSSVKNASPKTPTPAKKSPKSKTTSPKVQSPGKKSPNSKSASPAQGRSPSKTKLESLTANKQPKTPRRSSTAGQVANEETATGKRRSGLTPQENATVVRPAKTPVSSQVHTPTVQGRFSVSRISTPSPVAEEAVKDQTPLVTPKIPLRRKSMKSTSRKTPSVARSAGKLMLRRSGISRASMKASWADIVKFGQTKVQVVAPAKQIVNKKTTKKIVSKPQTPARKPTSHVSTGHADSPVTILVGRAHKQKVVHPTGTAPRVVTNTALFKKNMKMDEDLTGISDMFKTPANERKRRSVINENSATKTPVGGLTASVVEPSVLNTPEELGEMIVSPLSVASSVKERRYNSEAVQRLLNGDEESSFVSDTSALEIHTDSGEQQCTDSKMMTPKQKPEQQECLTGVKRIMKTPRQKAEPIEDIRGRLLKTPKQKPEQQECLTGVKRIMKTPRQKAEPIEDIRGRLLKTPKQKPEQQECLTGLKRIMKTPEQEAEPLEDIQGELLKTPEDADVTFDVVKELETPTHEEESENVPEMTDMKMPNLMSSPLVIKKVTETPREKSAPVENFEEIQELVEEPLTKLTEPMETIEGETQTPLCDGLDMAKGDATESSDAKETISLAAVEENLPEEQLKTETATSEATEMNTTATDPDDQKKPVRGRRATMVESEDKQEATEQSEDPIVFAPVRGRRGKKTEAAAPPAVKQTTRVRNAKSTESKDAELMLGESSSPPSKVALKPKRGRNAKKVSDQVEMVPEPESEQSPSVDVSHAAGDSVAPLGKAVVKPKRGRKTKQESEPESVPEQEDVLQADEGKADAKEVSNDHLEVVPIENDETKSSDTVKTVTQASETNSLPEVETPTCKVTEIIQKKPVRGRRAKLVDSTAAEDNQESAELCEVPVDSAPVRGRRGKKTAATAPPAVRQTTRGRNAKSQQGTSDDQPIIAPEILPEATPDQTPVNTSAEEKESPNPEEEAVLKPRRGRKTKNTPVEPPQSEPENSEIVSDQQLTGVDQPQQPVPTDGKQRRGRKRNPDTVDEVAEDTVDTVEPEQLSQPPVRAKRGRNAKHAEKAEIDGETTQSQESVTKSRRTRKTEQNHTEPQEKVQTVETHVQEEAEAPLAVAPVNEQVAVAPKPRRGGRKARQDTESATPVESTQEVPVNTTDKPKRGRRVNQVTEEVLSVEVPEENTDLEMEEKQQNDESNAAIIKTSRRGVKTSVKNETIPAKRARRGPAPSHEETKTEAALLPSESAPISLEPAKRGRRAASKPTADDATVSSDQAKLTEDVSSAVVEDTKMSKKSVKWKADLKVFDITPVKTVRSRKSKQEDTESNKSHNGNKTEENDLSDKVAESQPAKRARRGAKVAHITTDDSTSKVNPKKGDTMPAVETEPQPKTRRGRSAKK
ncbi:hypothetical protein PAMA_012635 [Pampus argenteus]